MIEGERGGGWMGESGVGEVIKTTIDCSFVDFFVTLLDLPNHPPLPSQISNLDREVTYPSLIVTPEVERRYIHVSNPQSP